VPVIQSFVLREPHKTVIRAYRDPVGVNAVIVAGGLGQLAGAALFVLNIWVRVRMPVTTPPPMR